MKCSPSLNLNILSSQSSSIVVLSFLSEMIGSYREWLLKHSGLESINSDTVSGFIKFDITDRILSSNDLEFLTLYYVLKFKLLKNNGKSGDLCRKDYYFLTAAEYHTNRIFKTLSIDFDYEDLFNKIY